jgi:hypothetical protein
MTFRHRLLHLDALGLVKKGDGDMELFEVFNDILKKGKRRVNSLIEARKKAAIEKANCN